MQKEKLFDLEDRIIDFAVRIIKLSETLPNSQTGKHVRNQMIRSGTSPAPNYAEARSAESCSDFIHKIKISLKELRETKVWLRIIEKTELISSLTELKALIHEANELISILVTSVKTATRNHK
ncbi:MAG: four helix bundle protein [Desulfobacterales bacterium]|nr:four helix bundle protein [Desulfobacterales bacterium]